MSGEVVDEVDRLSARVAAKLARVSQVRTHQSLDSLPAMIAGHSALSARLLPSV